jgi:predicted PurR-regulated permease PerM
MTGSSFTEQKTYVEKILITVGIVFLAYIVYQLFFSVFDVILLIFAAILLAVFLCGLAGFVNRYLKISDGKAVLLVSVLLILILGGAVALLAPSVAKQVEHLREELPKSAQQAGEYISQFGWGRTLIEQMPSVEEITRKIDATSILTGVGGFFSSTVGALGNFFITILLAIYLATEPKFYAVGFTKLFPVSMRSRVYEVLAGIGDTLGWWLIGKAASMVFIGLLTWLGLYILGVPLSLTLGLLAGLLSFIPNFGPIISALPAILLAFIESPMKAVYVLILFVIVQIIESNIVTPLIERETVELPPALTIIFQLILAVLIGGLGLVLATPLLAVIMVLIQMVYIEDILGDKNTEVKENQAEKEEITEPKDLKETKEKPTAKNRKTKKRL